MLNLQRKGVLSSYAPTPIAPPEAPKAVQGTGLWDPGNRHKTLLAIGTGLLSGRDFFSGVGAAGQNILGLSDRLEVANKKKLPEIGGPDNSFEIHTDPETGERTYKPIAAFQDYKRDTREKPKDVADMTGRAMYNLSRLPKEEQAAAYADMVANPKDYGLEPDWIARTEYDPNYVAMRAGMGSNVSQSRGADTRDRGTDARISQGERRLGIYGERSEALTRQGDTRVGLAVTKANAPKAPPSTRKGKGSSGSKAPTRFGPQGQLQMRVKKKR